MKLNVGGCLYYTTLGTLTKHDNMLRAMFSGRMEVLTDVEGKRNARILENNIEKINLNMFDRLDHA